MEKFCNPKRRRMAREYGPKKTWSNWFIRIGMVLYGLAFFGWRLDLKLYDYFTGLMGNGIWKAGLFLSTAVVSFWLVLTALKYFFDYSLDKEYKMTNQTGASWLIDQVKYVILTGIGVNLAGGAFFYLAKALPQWWWAPYALGAFVFFVVLAFLLPVVFIPLFFKTVPYPEGSLKQRLENLFAKVGIKVQICEINLSSKSNKANAAVVGLGNTRKILLGDYLSSHYTEGEIEAVMAHEIGHHVHRDIGKLIGMEFIMIVLVSLCTSLVWPALADSRGLGLVSGLPTFMLMMGFFYWILSPVEKFLSRVMEKQADAYALNLIDDQLDLARAFAKLADERLARPKVPMYDFFFDLDHPPIFKRIEMAEKWKKTKSSGGKKAS